MRPPARFLAITAIAASALVASLTAPATAATPHSCGGRVSDYVGYTVVDTPFTGTATVNGTPRPLAIAPVAANQAFFRVETVNGPDVLEATAPFILKTDPLGIGKINFQTFTGEGRSFAVACASGTRVTKITGRVETIDGKAGFTVSRR